VEELARVAKAQACGEKHGQAKNHILIVSWCGDECAHVVRDVPQGIDYL